MTTRSKIKVSFVSVAVPVASDEAGSHSVHSMFQVVSLDAAVAPQKGFALVLGAVEAEPDHYTELQPE